MVKLAIVGLICLVASSLSLIAQTDQTTAPAQVNPSSPASTRLVIRAMVIDRDLNVKPLPKFVFIVRPSDPSSSAESITVATGLDGSAETMVAPGRYEIASEKPLNFENKQFSWE